jgi:hypothetical protein
LGTVLFVTLDDITPVPLSSGTLRTVPSVPVSH